MKLLRVYIDTSVVGGCFEAEFQGGSLALFAAARAGAVRLIVSDFMAAELLRAPEPVREQLNQMPSDTVEHVRASPEALELAERYIDAGVIGRRWFTDAVHIAIATVNRVDVLVSWNFKHIVNLSRVHGYNSVNLREGYPLLEIRTPREVTADEEP